MFHRQYQLGLLHQRGHGQFCCCQPADVAVEPVESLCYHPGERGPAGAGQAHLQVYQNGTLAFTCSSNLGVAPQNGALGLGACAGARTSIVGAFDEMMFFDYGLNAVLLPLTAVRGDGSLL